ncbi:MAG: STAS domain-containing protein [Sedimentisphaerales bacterium]|nr:STAS domain-containing protein [Sedimentisphaerales bacterium]
MKLKTQDYNDLTVVELQGELTADVVGMLKNAMSDIVSKKKLGIVLDFNSISFIDSAGLEQLLWLRDYCRQNSCALKLAAMNEQCGKILEITRLEKEFDRYGELSEAVKSLA